MSSQQFDSSYHDLMSTLPCSVRKVRDDNVDGSLCVLWFPGLPSPADTLPSSARVCFADAHCQFVSGP